MYIFKMRVSNGLNCCLPNELTIFPTKCFKNSVSTKTRLVINNIVICHCCCNHHLPLPDPPWVIMSFPPHTPGNHKDSGLVEGLILEGICIFLSFLFPNFSSSSSSSSSSPSSSWSS
ncbi:hypothetical protein Hanom_Chr09g00841861 [Helianthus anomalus]